MNTKGFKHIEREAARKRAKRALVDVAEGKTPNELAEQMAGSKAFTHTPEWCELRLKVLETYGRTCMKCGATPRVINVDHIKPRRFYPDLAMVFDNLQVLCARCNKAKGNKHCTDYRPITLGGTMSKATKLAKFDRKSKVDSHNPLDLPTP